MREFFNGLYSFIKGSIHHRLLNKGLGEFSKEAVVVPINSYRFAALPGRRRRGMQKKNIQAKIITFPPALKRASSN